VQSHGVASKVSPSTRLINNIATAMLSAVLATWLLVYWLRIAARGYINRPIVCCCRWLDSELFRVAIERGSVHWLIKDWFSENAFSLRKWLIRKSNGTIRKCSSKAFQWMVMSVGFDNLEFFWIYVSHLLVMTEVTIRVGSWRTLLMQWRCDVFNNAYWRLRDSFECTDVINLEMTASNTVGLEDTLDGSLMELVS
jgi:hypothetical protein